MRMFRPLASLLALALPFAGASAQEGEMTETDATMPELVYVEMETSEGDILIELNHAKAPVTVENFLRDGTVFHRVIGNFMIQGGGFTEKGVKKETRDPIVNEWRNGLTNRRGTIAMARLGNRPDSATSQFFINVKDNPALDQPRDGAAYAVFGEVIEGMDVVDAIRNVETRTRNTPTGQSMGDWPVDEVVIENVRRIDAEREAELREERLEAERDAWRESLDEAKEHIASLGHDPERGSLDEETGMWILELEEGDGVSPEQTDAVRVHYTGWLTTGTLFDSSRNRGEPLEFQLTRVIPGWTLGVSKMNEGDRWIFVIPSGLAYGSRAITGAGGRVVIPSDSTLVFDVELLEVK
jgi:peptidyl-prolyl cis-trans isomerase A (cyclophilin A)